MSDFQRTIAASMKVSVRTVRRWCETGRVPGAYQTKGGHWRLRRAASEAMRGLKESERKLYEVLGLLTIPRKTRERVAQFHAKHPEIIETARKATLSGNAFVRKLREDGIIPADIEQWKEFQRQHRLADEALNLSLAVHALRHGLTLGEVWGDDLRERCPEMADLMERKWQEAIVPWIMEAMQKTPQHPERSRLQLHIAAVSVQSRDERVTARAIAKEMEICRAKLYRRYSPEEIKNAINRRLAGSPAVEPMFDETKRRNGIQMERAT